MKRIMKKLMCVTIVLLFVIFNMQGVFAQEDEASKMRINNQGRSLENAAQIEKIIFGNAELEDSYAGLYLDENGNLVVNYVGDYSKIKDQISTEGTTFKNVSNNLKALEDANQKFQNMLGQNGIQSVELSIKNNRVIVTYSSTLDFKALDTLSDGNAVQFIKADPVGESKFTANVINGKPAGTTSGTSGKGFTIGCRAKNTSTGKVGVLIPGHLFPSQNTNVYYDGGTSAMGLTKNTQCSGKVDATFVQTNSSFTPTLSFADGDSYEYASVDTGIYGLREGLSVVSHSWKSGRSSGVVLSTNFSEVVGGINMTNMVKCDYKAIGGDSGAAVTYDRYIGSASSKVSVMGLQSFSYLVNDAWSTGTSYSCFSRIDYIYSTLGLSDY